MARLNDEEIRIELAERLTRGYRVIEPELVITDPPVREVRVRVVALEPAKCVVLEPKVVVVRDRRA